MEKLHSTWEYYTEEYHGSLPLEKYQRWVLAANAYITFSTGSENQNAPEMMRENLKRCECEVADVLYEFSQVPRGVVSVDNDGYKATFGSRYAGGSTESETIVLERICRRYLTFPVNLLYRGVYHA